MLIAAAVLFGHSPVLFSDYLRQDDWSAATWNLVIQDHVDLRAHMLDEFRPLSVPFILFSDFVSHTMSNGWIVRLINILLLGLAAILTYRWQRLFTEDILFAACFAICAFLTQSVQIISATANYTVMIVALIWSQAASFMFYRGFVGQSCRRRWYFCGVVVFYLSLLSYPLASTYVFVFLTIYYFHHIRERWWQRDAFLFQASVLSILSMASIIVLGKLTYALLHFTPHDPNRSIAIDWDIPNKLAHWWMMLEQAFNFYAIDYFYTYIDKNRILTYQPVLVFGTILILGISCNRMRSPEGRTPPGVTIRWVARVVASSLLLLTLAFAPVFPPHFDGSFPFRYGLVIMPVALYLVFWSIREIARTVRQKPEGQIFPVGLCAFTICMIVLCSDILSKYVVSIHEHELHYISSTIENEALTDLKSNKPITIYLLMSDRSFMPGGFGAAEYGIGMSYLSPGWLLAGTIHVLRNMGYESIETEPPYKIIDWNSDRVIFQAKWGYIIATQRKEPHIPSPTATKEVIIDMNNVGTIW